ncbi:hypothetical protein FACS1894202_07760 [Clostridia bacterium]|nr:hypothetical protein FACS1894202_07760 [Clostridia bacterium]
MIIYNRNLNFVSELPLVLSRTRRETLNGENTLTFATRYKVDGANLIQNDNIICYDGDYFDIATVSKSQEADGYRIVSVECEHVSYRLNDEQYNVDYFTQVGSPADILAEILDGTGFAVGTVEFSDTVAFSLQEQSSRRGCLLAFARNIGGELVFNDFSVSIVQHRGSTAERVFKGGVDILIFGQNIDNRRRDENSNPSVSYSCSVFKPQSISIGDDIRINYESMNINVPLRVISLERDVENHVTIEVGNRASLSDDMFRIFTSKVSLSKWYYGTRISSEYGIQITRSAGRSDMTLNSDTWEVKIDNQRVLYIDYTSAPPQMIFDGQLSATLIEALSGIITPYIYAEDGVVAMMTVTRLRTDLKKPWNYLNGDTSTLQYRDISDWHDYYVVAQAKENEPPVQYGMADGQLLWWYQGIVGGQMTTNPDYAIAENSDTPAPVMCYDYAESINSSYGFEEITMPNGGTAHVPVLTMGLGGNSLGWGKGKLYKDYDSFVMSRSNSTTGEDYYLRISNNGVEMYPNWYVAKVVFSATGFAVTAKLQNDSKSVTNSFVVRKDMSGNILSVTNVDLGLTLEVEGE